MDVWQDTPPVSPDLIPVRRLWDVLYPIHGGPTLWLTGHKGSAANILVPDTTENGQWFSEGSLCRINQTVMYGSHIVGVWVPVHLNKRRCDKICFLAGSFFLLIMQEGIWTVYNMFQNDSKLFVPKEICGTLLSLPVLFCISDTLHLRVYWWTFSVAVKNNLGCHSLMFRLEETSFKMPKCYFDFLECSVIIWWSEMFQRIIWKLLCFCNC